MRTLDEIYEQQNRAAAWSEVGKTAYRSASYEDGVNDALAWVRGDTNVPAPIEEDLPDEE